MATLVLSAIGASLGSGFGGTVLGLTGAVIGRAAGAAVGRAIDQRLLGGGGRAVETGRIDRLRLQTAGEGAPIPRVWGQMRVPGHVIWASPVEEVSRTEGGGGKGGSQPKVTQISYRLSLAVALCEGVILGVGRVWADGEEVAARDLNLRVYCGDTEQMPDPAIVAHEGDAAPAYRGTAYVVLEDLHLERWGNRMPQLTFEVTRAAQDESGLPSDVRAVAMIPGTGEYSLATTPVTLDLGLGESRSINVNTPMGGTDFAVSMDVLGRELPNVGSVALVVSWFGSDLRINHCTVQPKVEHRDLDGSEMPWRCAGITRGQADEIAQKDGSPIYGGTPSDQSVTEALRAIAASGRKAVFYPFILMEQMAGNNLPNPYGTGEQPVMPWRGRVTTSVAAGRPGSPDGTVAAAMEVDAFFGQASIDDFRLNNGRVEYTGPAEWSYRRFILHYAHLCANSGGIDAFLIASEMIGMTQIRGAANSYPAVAALRRLAADVRSILGPDVKIGYASDWSEYFGHHPGNGELFFHLDPLWSDPNIDFIGIDNYMPLSDWRDGDDHLDAHWRRIDNPEYLAQNVAGGEGFDWYYASDDDRDAQLRTPTTDGTYDEAWVWRYKDLKSWWQNLHYDRPGGVRSAEASSWVPGSKPIWFTEIGCAALDKGTNQPNKFLDAMSSESSLPHYSNGGRDDALQAAYIRAITAHWADPQNNPARDAGGRMVDVARTHVWCWDARPYPAFPNRRDLWSDGPAWTLGHWLNGRAGAVTLASVVRDICREAGLGDADVSRLSGVVRGYLLSGTESARAALQPLMLAHGFDAVERDGSLRFLMRGAQPVAEITPADVARTMDLGAIEHVRAPDAQLSGRIRLTHLEAGGDYAPSTVEVQLPDQDQRTVGESEFPLVMTRSEGQMIAHRWLNEAQVAQDTIRFALPPSRSDLAAGDVVRLRDGTRKPTNWRIDRIERAGALTVEAVRVEPASYQPALSVQDDSPVRRYVPPMPVLPVIMDLPLMRGDEVPHAPWLAVSANPWPGSVAAYMSLDDEGGFEHNLTLTRRSIIGRTQTPLLAARVGVFDRGAPLRLRLGSDALASATERALMAGANLMAIGSGRDDRWELFQFTNAEPVGARTWEISNRLRGQAGTDAVMPAVWPEGSLVVLMNGAPEQVHLPPTARGQERFWRVGPAMRSPDDPSYRGLSTTSRVVGLRPYAPCHLRLEGARISWIRRTRVGGDAWDGPEVPLGEAREAYLVRAIQDGIVMHEATTTAPEHVFPAALITQLVAGGSFTIAVAQVSDEYGVGPFVRREFNA